MKNKTQVLFLIAVMLCVNITNAAVVYVKRDATGTNNGSSWTNAYTNLQTALTNAPSGSDIWITGDTFYLPAASARTVSFTITNKNLNLYGGFPKTGNPSSLAARNIAVYKTIISGDINKNDASFSTNTTTSSSDRSDNAYHVFSIALGANNFSVNFDGITIESGNANGSGNDGKGAGVYYTRNANGNGNQYHRINFYNCEFRYQTATEAACYFSNFGYTKCDMVVVGLLSNKFYSNTANDFPIFSLAAPTNCSIDYKVEFTSNAVYRNTAKNANSGLMLASGLENTTSTSYFNYFINFNSFSNNSTNPSLGLICVEGPKVNLSYCAVFISNNITYLNSPSKALFARTGKSRFTNVLVDYNMFESTDSFVIKYDGGHNIIGETEIFTQGASDNYKLIDCAKAINSGSLTVYYPDKTNTYNITLSSQLDANYSTRIKYNNIDRGAFEYNGNKYPVYNALTTNACFGESITFNGKNITTSGTYKDTFTGSNGCDSFIINEITVLDSLKVRIGVQFNTGNWYVGCQDANSGFFNTYQWYINDTLVPGANTYYLARVKFGKYYCKITKIRNGITCSDQSPNYLFLNPNANAIKMIDTKQLNVKPNPTENRLTWNAGDNGIAVLSNMSGQILVQSNAANNNQLDLSHLPAGIYLLKFSNKSGAVKIIKN